MLTCFDCGAEVRRGRVNCMEGHLFVSLHRKSRDVRVRLEKWGVSCIHFWPRQWMEVNDNTLRFVITVITLPRADKKAAKHQSKVVIFPAASPAPDCKIRKLLDCIKFLEVHCCGDRDA